MFVLAINSLPQKLNKNISEMTKTDISMVDKTDAKKIQFLKLWETIFNSMFTPVTIPFKKCQQWPAQINRQRRPVVSIVNKLVLFFYSSLWRYLTTGHSQNVPHHMKHHMEFYLSIYSSSEVNFLYKKIIKLFSSKIK